MDGPTIAAIATPAGRGGIGIVKLSGKDAISIAETIFKRKKERPSGLEKLPSHRISHGYIINPENEQILDEVLISVMRGPNSYTRENVVEINSHSGIVVLEKIMEVVLNCGAVWAQPGEFTKRAFLNGRIDLTQAEAVIDIINAKSVVALKAAVGQMKGGLKDVVEISRKSLVDVLSNIEAEIEFNDDMEESFDKKKNIEILKGEILHNINDLISSHEENKHLRDGLKIVIAGKPNVGKSTLMNKLLKKERSIVTEIPGTTRDVIESEFIISGITTVLTDTAGIQETRDPVEKIGIKKTREAVGGADILLYIIEANKGVDGEDIEILEEIEFEKRIVVLNKTDKISKQETIANRDRINKYEAVEISALMGTGVEELEKMIAELSMKQISNSKTVNIPNSRHGAILERCRKGVERAIEGFEKEMEEEIVALELKGVVDGLNEILGINGDQKVLDNIFNSFCIGK